MSPHGNLTEVGIVLLYHEHTVIEWALQRSRAVRMPLTDNIPVSSAAPSTLQRFSLSSLCLLRILTCVSRTLPDVVTTPEILGPLLDSSTAFLLIQNGVGIEDDLRRAVPSATILSACAWIFATVVEDGKKMKQTGRVSLHFIHIDILTILLVQILLDVGTHHESLDSNTRHPKGKISAQVIADLFRAGGLNVTETNDIQAARWIKALW